MSEAHLVLADGTVFSGGAIGATGVTTGEAVFTTGMTGYQEVLTDPSYCGQIVTLTAPQIGNTGINDEDGEARQPFLSGLVVHELARRTSSWRARTSLDAYLRDHGIVGIEGIDTRALTRHIRDAGAQMAALGTESIEALLAMARAAEPMEGRDLTGEVTTDRTYEWSEGLGAWGDPADRSGSPTRKWHVVCVDLGVKYNILRCLVNAGCTVTIVPARTSADDILALAPDGVFLSNGPGDPAPVLDVVATIRDLLGKKPIFGICLGHQLLALALGGRSYKLKFGHRGLNHPVKDLTTGRIEITTQNHGFAIDVASLRGNCRLTHVHLNDDTCMGIAHEELDAFGVQFHPEAAAGPHDSRYLFQRFVTMMDEAA